MTCYHPLDAFQLCESPPEGVRKIWFSKPLNYDSRPIKLPCGQCKGCRLERSRQWAIRCSHEASQHDDNAFITLTYNDDALPSNGSLDHRHFQLFMKKLRKSIYPKRLKFYMCGEYGDLNMRPHYHACLFGHDFKDKQLWKERSGIRTYISDELAEIWGNGFITTGDVTFESAAYVARYVMKKRTGPAAIARYTTYDPETGEILRDLKPEYNKGSNGIAKWWVLKNREIVMRRDEVICRGRPMQPPRYYDRVLEAVDGEIYRFDHDRLEDIKADRVRNAQQHPEDQTPSRLRARELIQEQRAERLVRPLDQET